MAFQWGWGNDVLLPSVAATAFDAIDDGESWRTAAGASVAATLAGGLFWAVTQTFDGIVVLTGLRLIPGVTARIGAFLQRKGWVKPVDELSFGTKFLIAYATGASVLCLVDVFATGRQGLRGRWRLLGQAVAMSAGGVAVVIAVIASATSIGARVEATEYAADVLIRYAKNPLTWFVIYTVVIALSTLRSRLKERKAVDAAI